MNEQIEALQSMEQYLDKLKSGISRISDSINNGKVDEGCALIPVVSEGLDWIIKVITLTYEVQKEKIIINDINEHLNSIIEALENEDYILVGDLFNYEILPILDRIHDQIRENLK